MNWLFHDSLPDCCRPVVERHAKWTVAVTLLVSLVFACFLPHLRFENAPGKLDLPADDPVQADRDEFEARFGGGRTLLIGLQFEQRIDTGAVRIVRQLADSMVQLEGVTSVTSIATATKFQWMPSMGVHVLRPTTIVPRPNRANDTTMDKAVRLIQDHPAYGGTLLSQDGRSTAIVLTLDPWSATDAAGVRSMQDLVGDLKRIASVEAGRMANISIAGIPVLNIALQEAMRRDLSLFGPLSAAAFVIILFLMFRNWRPVVSGLVTALLALIWSIGMLPMTGTPMSLNLSMIIPLVLSFSLMYSIHHLACICHRRDGAGVDSRVIQCWQSIVTPNVLCGITTCLGFLSLGTSWLEGIREVGIFVGFGVVASTLLANIFLPALLTLVAADTRKYRSEIDTGLVGKVIPRLTTTVIRRPGTCALAVAVITIAALVGVSQLRVETNHLAYLSRDRAVTESFEFVDSSFGGVLPLEILVDVPREHSADAIPVVAALQDSLRALDGLGSVISAADFIVRAEQSKPRGARHLRPALHLDRGYVPAQIWRLVTRPTAGGRYVEQTDSSITLRISCRAHIAGSDRLRLMLKSVRGLLDRHVPNYRTTVTGLTAYFARVEEYVLATQITSFAVALVVTVLLLGLLGGSLRVGLVIVAVNFVPVALVLGTMGWLDIPLDISTVMIAAIALGIVVDDTIHLVYRYRRERLTGGCVEDCLARAYAEAGLPVLTTTVILSIGFASLIPARFVPTTYFGALSMLTVLVAAIADMILLPALIVIVTRRQDGSQQSGRTLPL